MLAAATSVFPATFAPVRTFTLMPSARSSLVAAAKRYSDARSSAASAGADEGTDTRLNCVWGERRTVMAVSRERCGFWAGAAPFFRSRSTDANGRSASSLTRDAYIATSNQVTSAATATIAIEYGRETRMGGEDRVIPLYHTPLLSY